MRADPRPAGRGRASPLTRTGIDRKPRPMTVTLHETGLSLPLGGEEAYFNYFWLRDNCPTSFDPVTRERSFDISALEASPRAATAAVEGDTLTVSWAGEEHVSRYGLAWLEGWHRNGRREDPARLPRRLWYAGHHADFPRFDATAVGTVRDERMRFARALLEEGIAVVGGMEDSDAALTRLCNTLGEVRPTFFGFYFDVRLHIDPINLAYTAGALEMHTDVPAEETAPGVQFLHCRRNSVEGGYSLFLDGAAVAEDFRREHPEDFALLVETDIPFFCEHDSFDCRAHQRVIELDRDGSVAGVTISQHLADVFDLPQRVLDRYYPALHRFHRALRDARYMNRFRLEAGQCIVFDNHRIVHGREAYVATSGERYLRGCYVDRGDLRSTFRTLARAQREAAA